MANEELDAEKGGGLEGVDSADGYDVKHHEKI